MLFFQKLCLTLCILTRFTWISANDIKLGLQPSDVVLYRNDTIEINFAGKVTFFKNYNSKIFGMIFLNWAKIVPDTCTIKVNKTELLHYQNLIDELLQNNIDPIVVLHSGDLPEMFAPLGGWTHPFVVPCFKNYAKQVFKILNPRVNHWVTIYKPKEICQNLKSFLGEHLPSGIAEYECIHNILKAHTEVYHTYKKMFQSKGKVGISLDVNWVQPKNKTDIENLRVVEKVLQFEFGLLINPLFNYDYPKLVIDRVFQRSKLEGFTKSRLPEFSYYEKEKISGACDYLWIISENVAVVENTLEEAPITIPALKTDVGAKYSKFIKANKMSMLLDWIKETYHNVNLQVTP